MKRHLLHGSLLALALAILMLPASGRAQTWDGPRYVREYADSVLFIQGEATLKSGGSSTWTGTAFIVHEKGFVLTNSHMVPDGEQFQTLRLWGSARSRTSTEKFELQIIKRDPELDLALLRLPERPTAWKKVQIGDSNSVALGQRVFVLGFPLDRDMSPAEGTLGSTNNERGRLQTTAPLNPGNSGGPVFDDRGDVIGIVVGGIRSAQGISFLVPVNYARGLLRLTGPPF
jgi:serine protease Do